MAVIAALLLLFSAHQLLASDTAAPHWNYDVSSPEGPDNWKEFYLTCGSDAQSPIDIQSYRAHFNRDLGNIHFNSYDKSNVGTFNLKNTGHNIQIDILDSQMSINGGGLLWNYQLTQFHFHWGSTDVEGSEHLINGKASAAEIHLVHWNADKYSTFTDASTAFDGLAVVGVLVQVTDDSSKVNKDLEGLTKLFTQIPDAGDAISIPAFQVKDILPASPNFYRYKGSLTTPACSESVTWTVMMDPIYVTADQMEAFRAIHNAEGEEELYNFRPAQPVNDRRIYTNKM